MIISFLKPFFASKTRIKILHLFYQDPDKSLFVREITRQTDEQINSVRRELEGLENAGLFTHFTQNGKKFFTLNKDYFLYIEFKKIFDKMASPALQISKDLCEKGSIDLIILTGQFINDTSMPIDLFIVGNVSKDEVSKYIQKDISTSFEIRFAVISHPEFMKRIHLQDRILKQLIFHESNIIPVNTQKEEIKKYLST